MLFRSDPRHTSQTCNKCSHVARENRESQAIFKCVSCGHFDNADVNAAKNILVRGLTSQNKYNGLEPSLERGGDVRLERANSSEALICASPRKIFTSVNMLSSEAKPTHRVDTNGRVSIDFQCKGKSTLLGIIL